MKALNIVLFFSSYSTDLARPAPPLKRLRYSGGEDGKYFTAGLAFIVNLQALFIRL